MLPDQVESWGVPWEQDFGYVQAVKQGITIHVAGQFSHDSTMGFDRTMTPEPDFLTATTPSLALPGAEL